MARTRFNHVFIPLMLAAGAASFILPPSAGQALRGRIDGAFTPVSYPLRRFAKAVSTQWNQPDVVGDNASLSRDEALAQIQQLQNEVASLSTQIAAYKQIAAGRELLGDAAKYSLPFRVLGGEPSGRDALLIRASASDELSPGMAVVRRDALVGKMSSDSVVRLVTDKGFRTTAQFGRFRQSADGRSVQFTPASTPPPLVEGCGNGRLSITNLPMEAVKGVVEPGDYVVLKDPDDWPLLVNGYIIGQVESITPQARATLFADISVKPRLNLMQLNEVMVVVGMPSHAAAAAPARHTARPARKGGR